MPSTQSSSKTTGNGSTSPQTPETLPPERELIPAPKVKDENAKHTENLTVTNVFDNLDKARAREETEVSYSRRQISHIVVKRPDPHWFVRLHPDWEFDVIVYEDRENQGLVYYVWPELEEEIGRFGRRTELRFGVTTTGTYFL
jgi:hypothetical protein